MGDGLFTNNNNLSGSHHSVNIPVATKGMTEEAHKKKTSLEVAVASEAGCLEPPSCPSEHPLVRV